MVQPVAFPRTRPVKLALASTVVEPAPGLAARPTNPVLSTSRAAYFCPPFQAPPGPYNARMTACIFPLRVLLLSVSGWVDRRQSHVVAYLVEENRVLKEQLHGRRLRLTHDQRRRLAAKAKMLGRKALNAVAAIVTRDTLMRWHRRLFAAKLTYTSGKRVGCPGLMKMIKHLIVRMATENSTWGYSRIQGELKHVGHIVARTTVSNTLKENGIKLAPDHLCWGLEPERVHDILHAIRHRLED